MAKNVRPVGQFDLKPVVFIVRVYPFVILQSETVVFTYGYD